MLQKHREAQDLGWPIQQRKYNFTGNTFTGNNEVKSIAVIVAETMLKYPTDDLWLIKIVDFESFYGLMYVVETESCKLFNAVK